MALAEIAYGQSWPLLDTVCNSQFTGLALKTIGIPAQGVVEMTASQWANIVETIPMMWKYFVDASACLRLFPSWRKCGWGFRRTRKTTGLVSMQPTRLSVSFWESKWQETNLHWTRHVARLAVWDFNIILNYQFVYSSWAIQWYTCGLLQLFWS